MTKCTARTEGCGGCPLLDLPYARQLEKKQETAFRLLGQFGKVSPVLGAEKPEHYRNKAILTFARGANGRGTACGLYAAGTHRLIPTHDCLLQAEPLNVLLSRAAAVVSRMHIRPYDEDSGTGVLRHFLARYGEKTGELALTVVTSTPVFPGNREFVSTLRAEFPQLVTVVQNINPRRTSAVLGGKDKVLFGNGYLTDELCGNRFHLPAGAFYQVNHSQAERLYDVALNLADLSGTESVLDAYCGIGTITLAAAKRAGRAVGVELNPAAVRGAESNARHNRIQNAEFIRGDAGEILERMARKGSKFDVVLMDPTRDGASMQFLESLLSVAPDKIVYISCYPQTQARDLGVLSKHGYEVNTIQPVDMFPHTEHVEAVVLMSRV